MTDRTSKTVVFDLDDTLVKEIAYLESAFGEIATFCDGTDESLFSQMMDWYHQKKNVFTLLHERYDVAIEDLKQLYRNHFPKWNPNSLEKAFLLELKNKGYYLGVITDGYSITQRNKLKALQIEELFDLIVISEEFGSGKPNRENFLVFNQFQTAEYYYIGDNTAKDFITPNQLGWTTVCVLDDGNNIHPQSFELESVYLPQRIIPQVIDLVI